MTTIRAQHVNSAIYIFLNRSGRSFLLKYPSEHTVIERVVIALNPPKNSGNAPASLPS